MSKSGWIRSLAVEDPECSYHNQMYVHEMEKTIKYKLIQNPSNYLVKYVKQLKILRHLSFFYRNKDINLNMLKLVMKIRMLTM